MSDNIITDFFAWWNGAMREPALLTADGFARFFAADATVIVNGNLRATGPAEIAVHYAAIAARLEEVAMVLPVEQAFATADRAFVHCRTHVVAGGKVAAEEAMAYAIVADERITLFRVVSLSV